jgi:diguanylate cyclase (GGDEF)-like protein/PAS domain S-box-containing protein
MLLSDVQAESGYGGISLTARSVLCAPVWVRQRVVGVVNLESSRPGAFSEEDLLLASTVAGHVGLALEKARLLDEVRRRATYLETLIASSADSIATTDVHGILTFVSPESERILGRSTGELLGRPLWEFYVGGKEEAREVMRQLKEKGQLRDYETEFWHADGHKVPVSLSVSLLRDDEGRVTGTLGVATDITDRKKAEKQAESLQEIARALSSTLELEPLLNLILDELEKLVSYDSATVMLAEKEGLTVVASRGFPELAQPREVRLSIAEDPFYQQATKTRRPIILDDARADPRFRGLGGTNYVRGWICAPLLVRDRTIGLLTVDSREPAAYTAQDAEIVQTFADHAALALENARLYQRAERWATYLTLLNEIGRNVMASLDPDELLRRAADAIWRHFGYHNVGILMLDAREQRLVPAGAAGEGLDGISMQSGIPVGRGIMGHVARTGQTWLANDVTRDPYFFDLPGMLTQAELCVPIEGGGGVIGVLNVESREKGAFDEMDVRAMETLARQLAVALENARLYEQTSQLAVTDPLTGLANRRIFQERLAEEIRRARRYGRPLSLIMADLDHFKVYNDTHGHPAGDVILQQVADIMRANVRETDLVARYGGEEFVMILPETDKAGATKLAEKIRHAVSAYPFPHEDSQPGGRLTISLGVATFPEDLVETDGLIEHADRALYLAKQSGRNRVC